MRKIIIVILSIVLAGLLTGLVFFIAVYFGAFGHLQNRKELTSYKNATASIVLSEEGELIGKYFSENRTNVEYDQLPKYLIDALIATEDIRFFQHKGYDARSFIRVFVKTILLNRNTGGGSTITQQLAKNMYGRGSYGVITILVTKTKEIILASRLERVLSKNEILLLYLNTVSFGENVFGIEAAARRFFNKKVEDLKIEESAVLIGLLKANNYYNPRLYPENAIKRRNVVLSQMKKYEFIEPAACDSLMGLPLVQNYLNYETKGPADYFLYQVKNIAREILQVVQIESGKIWNIEEDGLVISTTINLTLQNYANQAFKDHLSVMQKRLNQQYKSRSGKKIAETVADREMKRLNLTGRADQPSFQEFSSEDSSFTRSITVRDSMIQAVKILQAGLMAMDPVTGKIKAWVGGIDFKSQPYDQVLARRQLASTFKPVIYTAALEDGISPCDFIDNDSIVDSGVEGWSPQNFDLTSGGRYSLAGALVHSMNIPTFNLYRSVGYARVDSLWKNMGFSYSLPDVPSVAMGTPEGSVFEVAVAYSAFANGGYTISPQSVESIRTADGTLIWQNDFKTEQKKIISDRAVILLTAMLRRAVLEGTGASLGYVYGVVLPLAGKTGTSQDYADAWFSAFNPSLVIVSRVGASSPAIHFNGGSNGSGSTLALPLIGLTLREVQKNKELSVKLFKSFPELPPEMADELQCPDFKEKTFFEDVIDIFKGNRKPAEKETLRPGQEKPKPQEKKKSFFRRLFEKKR